MSDLRLNKFLFCVLGTALLMAGLNEASAAVFRSKHQPAIWSSVAHDRDQPPSPLLETPRDYHRLFADADVAAGSARASRCRQCHHLGEHQGTLTGPELFGVLGRDIASMPYFRYSTGPGSLSEIEGVWTYEKLDRFLEGPKVFAPATQMNFAGINDPATGQADRINVIAYLRTLTSGEQMPLP